MNFPKDQSGENLEAWLTAATAGLSPASKARIEMEIQSHFVEAVSVSMASGKDQAAAEREALQALGNAWTARRSFRRSHLTDSDVKELVRLRAWADGACYKESELVMLGLALLCVYSLELPSRRFIIYAALMFFAFVVTRIIAKRLLCWRNKRAKLQALLLVAGLMRLTAGVAISLIFYRVLPSIAWTAGMVFYVQALRRFMLWKKTRSLGSACEEISLRHS